MSKKKRRWQIKLTKNENVWKLEDELGSYLLFNSIANIEDCWWVSRKGKCTIPLSKEEHEITNLEDYRNEIERRYLEKYCHGKVEGVKIHGE